ncbi:hypothetical protein [Bacillus sp. RAR_GA_16]|uniref:hypothetical protein n=1 Tax=Bacillus sp. RAR_GA_16 TaxID=2876774 RepID=UPI001CCD550F|nr:hypothetical protein [Bacillus sp. RAR_GA_16]MCA0172941.1 hypothetical protein [Bacillus sp. RAR_GA_16]
MSKLLLSKKFIPTYFIVSALAIVLYRTIGNSWIEALLISFPCFLVGIMSIALNFSKQPK